MSVGGIGSSGYNPYLQQFQKNLFAKIDSNNDGSVSKTELEQAVSSGGGTTQSADSLFSMLDPTNTGSVSEQQFAQNLSPPPPPPFSAEMGAQLIAAQSQQTTGASSDTTGAGSPTSFAQALFSQIDSNGDGSISKSELENAVTTAGGTPQAADALYSKLDPNGTGSVDEQQFTKALSQATPHHGHHHHAMEAATSDQADQDPLAALLGQTTGTGSSTAAGNSPEDALMALLDPAAPSAPSTGVSAPTTNSATSNSIQSTLWALTNSVDAPSATGNSAATSAASLASSVTFNQALNASAQANQQLFASLFGASGMLV